MGSLLLAAGAKDLRFALPNARIMVHQPSGGFQGQATDIMLHAQEILNLKKRLNEIYVKHTGQQLKKIEDALERDTFLTAEGAKEFGIIDKVIESRPEELPESGQKLTASGTLAGLVPARVLRGREAGLGADVPFRCRNRRGNSAPRRVSGAWLRAGNTFQGLRNLSLMNS